MSAGGGTLGNGSQLLCFEYLYRDASNYKAFGSVWLAGSLSEVERAELVECLDSKEFFVAEQVGIPALYPILFEHGGGPTEEDHAWHMFEGFREDAVLVEGVEVWSDASAFLSAFRAAKQNWRPELSPNFDW